MFCLYSFVLDLFWMPIIIIRINMSSIEHKLKKSKFRSRFKLAEEDVLYIKRIGWDKLKSHAQDFIVKRISPANPRHDGRQTPLKGHPVFIAQHATATCCRSCIYKWHRIPRERRLRASEISYVINLILSWISGELKRLEIDSKRSLI